MMIKEDMVNQRWVLQSRPTGFPTEENFRLEEQRVPEVGDNQILLKTRYLSLDPYMRGRMDAEALYAPPVEIGEVMVGGTICEVIESKNEGFKPGDIVLSAGGWQQYSISTGEDLSVIVPKDVPLHYFLSVLGMPGFTAYYGLMKIAAPKPGETVVISSAVGAVGSIVGQLAKIAGCKVVGITSGAGKCQYGEEVLGFDHCLDRMADDFEARLSKAVPNGIDVYFENVGGELLHQIMPHLNTHGRVPLCGLLSQYNLNKSDRTAVDASSFLYTLLYRRIRLEGFIIRDHYWDCFDEFSEYMSQLIKTNQIQFSQNVTRGLASAPRAFLQLLKGEYTGKVVVEVS